MKTFKINFWQVVSKKCEIEIDAESEEEAKDILGDYTISSQYFINSQADILSEDVIDTDITGIELLYDDGGEREQFIVEGLANDK